MRPIFVALAVFCVLTGCGADIEGFLDPCLYSEGEEITTTAFTSGKSSIIRLTIEDCATKVILRVSNPTYARAGARVKMKILRRNSEHSYEVKIIKVYD